jgi:hypothetical protein
MSRKFISAHLKEVTPELLSKYRKATFTPIFTYGGKKHFQLGVNGEGEYEVRVNGVGTTHNSARFAVESYKKLITESEYE